MLRGCDMAATEPRNLAAGVLEVTDCRRDLAVTSC